MSEFLSVGEVMVELSQAEGALWRLGFAGDTLNTAWYARALLPQGWTVSYFTRLGADPFSPRLLRFLDDNGLATRHITRDPVRSVGLYAIELNEGERSFAYWRGQSAARGLAEDAAALDQAFAAADAGYLSGITLAILPPEGRAALAGQMADLRARGGLTAFDPNIRPALWTSAEETRAALMACPTAIVLPSFDDEAALFGDATPEATVARWRAAGADEVVVKNGGGPVTVWARGMNGDAPLTIPVARVRPFDSTGAGDAFNGGYLAARLTGHAPDAAARAAHDVSLQVIARPGALMPMADVAPLPVSGGER